jgi:hypothetical protein
MKNSNKNLAISALQGESSGFTLKWFWYPGQTMDDKELARFKSDLAQINEDQNPLHYGYFAPDASEAQKKAFLDSTIWCVIYAKSKPVGFAYNVDLGEFEGKKVLHLGLVKINTGIGKDFIRVPYIPLGLGNLLNFGEYYATNVSHLPVIIDMVTWLCRDVYPDFQLQESSLRKEYLGVLEVLCDNYIVPVLKYDPRSICTRTFTIRGSLANADSGFNTDWNTIPKSSSFLCNLFVKEWLHHRMDEKGRMLIQDDMIQIGKVDFRFIGDERIYPVLNALNFTKPVDKNLSLFGRFKPFKIAS